MQAPSRTATLPADTGVRGIHIRRRFPLAASPAAYIPVAERAGGLGMKDVGQDSIEPVIAVLDPYKPYASGDQVVLLWDGVEVAQRFMSVADNDVSVTIPIPRDKLRARGDGDHELVARFIPSVGDPQDSAPYPCFVKTTRPGGPDKDPATETINESLAPPLVRPDPIPEGTVDGIQVIIQRYENIAVGDLIYVSWHGRLVPVPPAQPTPLTEADLARSEFTIPVPPEVVRDAGGGEILVRYRIIDRVGNNSLWSPGRTIEVPVDDPDAPPAPWVEGTVNDDGAVLRLVDIGSADVAVLAENHGGKKGEKIVVTWAGIANGQALPPYVTAPQELTRDGQTLTFTIPNAQVTLLGEGSVTVTYEFEGTIRTSRRRSLLVEGKASTLLPPEVENTPNNVLDAAKHKTGAKLIAPHQPERIPAGSFVRFQWFGLAEGSDNETANGVSETYGRMTYAQILALVGSTVTLNYRLETFELSGRRHALLAFEESPELVLNVIDSDTGGPGTLPAPSIRDAVADVLDPSVGFTHLDIRPLTKGDNITATIRASTVFTQTLPMRDLSRPPSFLVDEAYIASNINTRATASYLVAGTGGYMAESEPYLFTIGTVASDLPAPTVDQAPAGNLDPVAAKDGATVRVPALLTKDDDITVTFGTWISDTDRWSAGMGITVPPAEIAKCLGTEVSVIYTVNNALQSPVLSLHVLAFGQGDPRLPTPAVEDATGADLDLGRFNGDTHVTLEPWPLMAAGQRLWIHVTWSGGSITVIDAFTIQASHENLPLRFLMQRAPLETIPDGTRLSVRARVTFNGAVDDDSKTDFPVLTLTLRAAGPALYIDPSLVSLLVNDYYTRAATGGKPAYVYSSSNVSSVRIQDVRTGEIRAIGEGSAVITVTDSAQAARTYPVVVGAATPPLRIDPTPMMLEAGQASQRSAEGGHPPYTYKSLDPSIVRVTNVGAGNVLAVAAGTVLMTASDSTSATVSYSVTVRDASATEDFELAPIGDIANTASITLPTGRYQSENGTTGKVSVVTTRSVPPLFVNRSINGFNSAIWGWLNRPCKRMRLAVWCSYQLDIYVFDTANVLITRLHLGASSERWVDIDARPSGRTIDHFQCGMRAASASWAIDNVTYYYD